MNKKIIAFVGCIGSGKDFHATKLKEQNNFAHINFADAVRQSAWLSLGYTPANNTEYEKFKACTFKSEDIDYSFTGRDFLIRIGNDMGRGFFGDTFWIDRVKNFILSNTDKIGFCNSDTRYLNEVQALRDFASSQNFDLKFQFCNFKSDRYDKTVFSESEFLAQILTQKGIRDTEDITELLLSFIKIPPVEFISLNAKVNGKNMYFIFDIKENQSAYNKFLKNLKSMKNLEQIYSMKFLSNGRIVVYDEINQKIVRLN